MEEIILITIIGVVCGVLGAQAVHRYGSHIALIDIPNERSSHSSPTPRGGGVGIWLALLIVTIWIVPNLFLALLIGMVGLIGFLEDRFALPALIRLLFQWVVAAGFVLFVLGFPATFIMLLLSLFWVVFVVGTANFFNFMDGIDGIAGLTGVVAFGLLSFFAFPIVKNSDIALMSLALSAGCLGFLPFNFPKAKVFMGDVGSILLGFVFASFVMKLSSNIAIFLCLIMFLSTFYADALITVYERWRKGENLMKAHRSHLYQHLANEMNLRHWKVSVLYSIVQLLFGTLSILAYKYGIAWQIALLAIFGIFFVVAYRLLKGIQPDVSATSAIDEMSL